MPEETVEQTALVIPGADEATIEAPAGVVEGVADAVAGDGEAVAARPIVDLSTDEGIRAAIEANPTLAGYLAKQQADAANAARQRRDVELRREQGTAENAQAYHRWLSEQIANGADPEEIGRQTPLFVKANEDNARLAFAQSLLDHSISLLEPVEAAPLLAMRDALDPGDVAGTLSVAQASMNAVTAKARAQARAEAEAEAEAKYAAKLAAEIEAAKIEARTANITNPPQVSGMGPGVGSGIDPDRQRLQERGIPLTEEATRKRIAAALGVSL